MKYFISLVFIVVFVFGARAQDPKHLKTATSQAQKSSELVRQFAALGIESIPFEYLQKAKAVAVFPEMTKVNLVLSEMIVGNGIVSVRNGDDWSAPTFLAFAAFDINLKFGIKKSFDTVLLFMDDDSIGWLKNGKIVFNATNKKKVALGPVLSGKGTDKTMETANVIYYNFENGQLIDANLGNDTFFKEVSIIHNNNLNKAIFGKKARAFYAESDQSVKAPGEIEKFRTTLNEILSNSPSPQPAADEKIEDK